MYSRHSSIRIGKFWQDTSDEPNCPTTFNFDFEVIEEITELRQVILNGVHRFRQLILAALAPAMEHGQ